jgi:hypothetical protein
MPAHSKFDICSRALRLVGVPEIASFDDGTLQSTVAGTLYEATVFELITLHDWQFAVHDVQLTPATTPVPTPPWTLAYLLPADCLQERVLRLNEHPVEFERHGEHLFTKLGPDDLPVLEYFIRPDETIFTASFVQLLTYKLAELFATSITRNENIADQMQTKYDRQLANSTFQNSIARTNRRVKPGKLRGWR